ncbi:uncharacterized protein LOC120265593 isoform X2 [Dioscorea cayenensis subsp. rotundata]|uniref:Uncharacterized protein LOC120265593 isoform X2 n=1 Tax=Dioscorea cayennensis subsp. rotundata TaxID=55577 RepID=A0AB40BQ87_DIOCR|nr:uncharacterized protein LOC120265593 isoform X2 [Dioscorea cayenensis subsp. rotundata]
MNPLPNHLKFLPPSIPIPERYTWVVLHRRWTLIPKVLSNKFTPNDQTLTDPPLDDPMDEELVDWGDDEDDQKFVEEKNFMDKDNVIEAQEAHFQDDPFLEDEVPTEFGTSSTLSEEVIETKNLLLGGLKKQNSSLIHLYLSRKKIIPEDPREAGGQENLRIFKRILYLSEGASGLTINFSKSCLYSTNYGFQPNASSAVILNCRRDCLPFTYLGVPISGRRQRKQDWLKLILMVLSKLMSLKANYLYLGGHLTLMNWVLSSVPSYWMSVFKLPVWVIKEINKIRRDFLWKGPDLGAKGISLVDLKRICKPRELGGWRILNLFEFNKPLLGKWWWKIFTGRKGC